MSLPPPPVRMGGPLDEVNDTFHEAYDAQRAVAEEDPILVVLADELVLHRGDERHSFPVTTNEIIAAKSLAHAPVALWLLLQRPDDAARLKAMSTLRSALQASLPNSVASDTLRWMHRSSVDPDALGASLGPALSQLIARATKLQLDALHGATEAVLATLTHEQRRRLHVAVTGDHQARARSLPMQYFGKRFADADRVLYAEGVTEAEEAAALVGKQRLDREMAKAFFGNPRRLQRDVLGDAAQTELAAAAFERIDS